MEIGPKKKKILTSWISAMQNYFNFAGRASRYDFWAFMFVNLLLFLLWLGGVNLLKLNRIFWYVFLLYVSLPLFSITVRRLHDINLSGTWALPALSLVVLSITDWEFAFFNMAIWLYLALAYNTFLLWLLGREGNRYGNKYGPYIMEKNGKRTQLFLQHFNNGFLVGVWVAFFIYLFMLRA